MAIVGNRVRVLTLVNFVLTPFESRKLHPHSADKEMVAAALLGSTRR